MIYSVVLKGEALLKNPGRDKLKNLIDSKKNVVWLDLKDPRDEDYNFLKGLMRIHPLTIDDCRHSIEMPKIDRFEDYIFVVFHKVEYDAKERKVEMLETDAILGRNFIITVHKGERPSISSLMESIIRKPQIMARGPDMILQNIMDYIVDQYLPLLDTWDFEIEDLEEGIIRGEAEGVVEKLVDFRRRVSEMKKNIAPQRYVMKMLSDSSTPFISEKASIYFKDVYDHISKSYEILESQRDLVSNAFQAYSSNSSKQMNQIMKTLTMVTTIFLPLSLVAGIYGMNFKYMPALEHPVGYFAIMAVMMAIGLSMIAYFKKRGWA